MERVLAMNKGDEFKEQGKYSNKGIYPTKM
jgi:hypothetical protein